MSPRAPRRPSRRRSSIRETTREGIGRLLRLTVGEPVHGGACVARDDSGRVVFVRHTAPGEVVSARVSAVRSRLAWADAVEVLEPSTDRVDSVWPQAGPGGVGGGELSHLAPAAQRDWKRRVISGQLRRVGGQALAEAAGALGGVEVAPAWGDEEPSDPLTGRRSRIDVVIDAGGRAGMHEYRGRRVIALDRMPLAVPQIRGLGLFDQDSPWRSLWKPGDRVRAVAPSGGQPVVLIGEDAYAADGTRIDVPLLCWDVPIGGYPRSYGVRPSGFWQTHVRGAEVLANAVLAAAFGGDQAGEGSAVMELYSGAGLFTVPLARAVGDAGRVVSLEGDEAAVRDAGENVAGMEWVDVFSGSVNRQGIVDLSGQLGRVPDVLVADPPRAGAGAQVCQAIAATGAPRVVLVSCDPAAGARDLRSLTDSGYRLLSLRAWDLFPHTHHVEMVAVLSR
ncbi:TRAM domain protein [Schaalia meyeri]|uniref:class I SAM-dependent RNA methyltransferase n=1 Tax=Schaalia meyeri TaxID=52773 RepID=UPI00068319F8|nr:TRAM domain-containing protein [Schaalia meyeri]AKU64793.1 TRAM domain protein [Schaalia meyeri]